MVATDGRGGVVAYPYQYGGCHDAVVVVAFDGAHLFAVVFEFVNIEFEDGVDAAFYVEAVAQGFDEEVYYHGLCGGVGVESPFPRATFADVYLGGAAVEVGVFAGDFVEDVFEVVAFGAFGFEGVCFDYQQGVVVGAGDVYGFPCEFVVFDVAVPAGYDFGDATVYHGEAVGYYDAGVVGFDAYAADIDGDDIAVGDVFLDVGHEPYFEGLVVLDCFEFYAVAVVGDVAFPPGVADGALGELGVFLAEDAAAGGLEGFGGGGGELGCESPLFGDFFLFIPVPVDGFEGGAYGEEPFFVLAEGGDECGEVFDGFAVELDVEPCYEDGGEVVFPCYGVYPCAMEVVADAFGGGFDHFYCVGAAGDGAEDGLHKVFGFLGEGGFPDSYFGEVGHAYVVGADFVGLLCGADGDVGGADVYLSCGL